MNTDYIIIALLFLILYKDTQISKRIAKWFYVKRMQISELFKKFMVK